MNRAAQIAWWGEQVEAVRARVSHAKEERREPRSSGLADDELRRGRARAPAPVARAQDIIRGVTITGRRDEERARALLPAAGSGGSGGHSSPQGRRNPDPISAAGGVGSGGGAGQGSSAGRARQLAVGYQPAVIKVVSYARGVARATATGQYVQRENVPLETQDGQMLADREAVAEEIKAWSSTFAKRAESQDAGAVRISLHGIADTPEGRATYEKAIAAGLEGHRFAYRLDTTTPAGTLEARVVVAMAGASRERFRVREERVGEVGSGFVQKRFDLASEARVKERITLSTGLARHAITVAPGATSHGRDGVTYRLNKLIENGPAIDDRGKMIGNVADTRSAAREWGPTLRSQSSRDTMHLIISAKAGTDVEALTRAARAFLQDRFADHKFMFGVHTDKEAAGHIHAHAVIAVKSESGQKIHPSRETFGEWRKAYAEHAQAEGLKIVATAARERASSQSYGPKDKAIVEAADSPRPAREARDRAYAADPANRRLIENARQRIAVARANPIRLPISAPDREVVNESVIAWKTVAGEQPANGLAKDMLERLLMAQTVAAILHTIGRRTEQLTAEKTDMAVTSEQMARDLRLMNEAVSRTSDLLDGETKQQFRETSSRYLETLANRIDLQRASERGVQQMTRAEVEAAAAPNGDRLVERAREMQAREGREAVVAARLADRALEAERRQQATAGLDVTTQRELRAERAVVAGMERSAAQEAREAAAAAAAARSLAQHPGRPLSPSVVQTDALARLRAEQEQIIRDIEASQKTEAQSQSGQSMGTKSRLNR